MSRFQNRPKWLLILGFSVGIATTALPSYAAQAKNKTDLAAEAKAAADEEAQQQADRDKGIRHQSKFTGTFAALADDSQKPSPDVVGSFTTDSSDMKPGRTYLVKVADGNKAVLKTLMRFDGKKAQVTGKLRVLDQNGEAKYLVLIDVMEPSATPRAKQRGSGL
jgi:hypothetical protein